MLSLVVQIPVNIPGLIIPSNKTTSISQRKLGDIRVKLCHDSRFPVFLSDGVTDMHYQVLPMIISSIQVLLPG